MRSEVPSYQLYGEKAPAAAEFWLHCETVPERTQLHNWEIAPHRHDAFFQIFLLSSGGGEIVGGDVREPFAAPCAIFVPPGAIHGFRYSRDVDGLVVTALADRVASIADSDRRIAAFAEQIRVVALPPGKADAEFAVDCLKRLQSELSGHAAGRAILLENLMTSAIVALVRADGATIPQAHTIEFRDRLRVEELQAAIGLHFREHRPLAFYADKLGISATHLNRITRQETGLSVQQLIARRLAEAARRDLVFTPKPVQEIAYALGFSDPAYFNRFFRRQAGTTPGNFRKAERSRLDE
jgi:AraC family transcriptional regulator, transcriptional activator of pobA